MYRIEIEVSLSNIEIMDLVNAVALALGNSPDMAHARIHRITFEEADV